MDKNKREKINRDERVVIGFSDEWSRFTQETLATEEQEKIFDDYFAIFPWHLLNGKSVGADIGCSSR